MILEEFGPFFSAETHPAGQVPGNTWVRLDAILLDGAVLADRIDAVSDALASGARPATPVQPRRVAASVAHLGVVARLMAVHLATRAVGLGTIDLADGWCRPVASGPLPLSVTVAQDGRMDPVPQLVTRHTELMAHRFHLGGRVAWGNVASAANTAAGIIATTSPGLATAVRIAADDVLADPRVEGGVLTTGPGFRRRSCCLYHRAAGTRAAVCGDCVLTRP